MDTLPLHPLHSLLPLDQPFTPSQARAVGISRSALSRLCSAGHVQRVLRGVYAASTAPSSVASRAAAVGLLLQPGDIVVDRTAAWIHGITFVGPQPLDVLARTSLGGARRLVGRDIVSVGGVQVTSPVRTALDLGRLLAPGTGLGVLDSFLASGLFPHTSLLAELPRFGGQKGIAQLRALVAQVDARASCLAESVLRLHWNAARLPTPVPGRVVAAGPRAVRLSLAVERRQFGAVLAHQICADDLLALEGAGWWVVVLPEERVLSTDPSIWTRHLEREFHQQLLTQVKDEEEVG